MEKSRNPKTRFLRNIISCIVYIAAFIFIEALISVIVLSISEGNIQSLIHPSYWIRQSEINNHGSITYIICQIAAAALIIKEFSFKKLFFLSCIFIVISQWFDISLLKSEFMVSWDFGFITLINVLPYVAPVLILAIISRKKTIQVIASNVEKETLVSESEVDIQEKSVGNVKGLHNRYWYVPDIILIILVLLFGTLLDPFGLIYYVCGLYNQLGICADLYFIGFLSLVPAALCFLVLIFRMFVDWPKYISNKRRLLSHQIFVMICLLVYLVLPFLRIKPPGMRMYIAGFEGYVKKNADIGGTRSWLSTLNKEDFFEYEKRTKDRYKVLETKDSPDAISKLKPRFVTLSLDEENKPKVRLSWGSGFLGTWGFVVGNENLTTPESDLSWGGEYRQEIYKGVYLFYEIN